LNAESIYMRQPGNILLLLSILSLFSACSPIAPSGELQSSINSASVAPTTGTPQPIVITFGARDVQRASFEPLINRFNNENPDVRVQFVSIDPVLAQLREDFDTPFEQIARDLANTADTFVVSGGSEDAELDLRPFIETDTAFNPNDFWPGTLPASGPVRRLPIATSVTVFMYNRALLRARNVPEPRSDWTWADLKRAIEQLAQKDGDNTTTYGMIEPQGGFELALRGELATAGVPMNAERSQLEALDLLLPDNPAATEVIQNVTQLVRSGALLYDPSRALEARNLIISGQIGFWPRSNAFMAPDDAFPFETGVIAFPDLPHPMIRFDLFGEREYAVSSGTKHPDAAWRWLAFLSRQLPPEALNPLPDSLPVRRSTLEQNQVLERFPPDVAAAVQDALNQPFLDPRLPAGWTMDAIMDVLDTNTSPAVAAQAAYQRSKQSWLEALAQPTPTPGPPIVVATPALLAQASANAITIRFHASDLNNEALRRAAEAFSQANPQIVVDLGPSSAQNERLSDIAAASDCFAFNGAPRVHNSNQLLDLRPLLDADGRLSAAGFPAGLLTLFTREGRLLGLPHSFDGPVLVFRQELVQSLATPSNSWTFTDMQQAAAQFTDRSATPQYGFAIRGNAPDGVQTLLKGFGVAALAADGAPQMSDLQVQTAIRQVVGLLRDASPYKQLPEYARTSPPNSANNLILNGSVAMWLDTAASVQRDAAFLSSGQALGVIALPLGVRNAPRQVSARGLYISAQTQHAPECWHWLTYLISHAETLPPGMPAHRDLMQNIAFTSTAPPWLRNVYDSYINSLADANSTVDFSASWTLSNFVSLYWFNEAISRSLQGADLERELADAQILTEQYLACAQGGETPGRCARQVDPQYQGFSAP
jgi:ABC-type glycerol-3-phosphate transport system substrate-binding protein